MSVCLEIKDGKLYEKLRSRGKSVGLKWVQWNSGSWIADSDDITNHKWQGTKDEKHNVGLLIR